MLPTTLYILSKMTKWVSLRTLPRSRSERPMLHGIKIIYFILYSEYQCVSKLDKIGIFIDMKFYGYQISLIPKVTSD